MPYGYLNSTAHEPGSTQEGQISSGYEEEIGLFFFFTWMGRIGIEILHYIKVKG
jgi:hypothetical protein